LQTPESENAENKKYERILQQTQTLLHSRATSLSVYLLLGELTKQTINNTQTTKGKEQIIKSIKPSSSSSSSSVIQLKSNKDK
jgi:hypothetical protein